MKKIVGLFLIVLVLVSCKGEETNPPVNSYVESFTLNGRTVGSSSTTYDVATDSLVISIRFSSAIKSNQWDASKFSLSGISDPSIQFLESADAQTLTFRIGNNLSKFSSYTLTLYSGNNLGINLIDSYFWKFTTEMDTTPRFPIISDDSLLTLVQHQTFEYFWKYGHPVSGLARERLGSDETVTIGGSGFGLMALITGINRGFITREQGYARLDTIVNFLSRTSTDKYHGVFPHWMNGTTGKTQPFTSNDNGADLVETAFLFQGLLTVQAYFKNGNASEKALCTKIQTLWENVEWTWFQQNGQEKLFWHWSPDKGWIMNMPVSGWNEGLIIYVLAASSPTHPITKSVYTNGWANNGSIRNGNNYYGITLPLGESRGGPLFFTHYSFLGLDPRHLSDTYANYFEQNQAHARINFAYCVANPRGNYGYGGKCWGLTASDIPGGYTASSPNNDVGVIAPTGALSSFPYTPVESMAALRFYYYTLGDKLWGTYGFKDAFSLGKNWFADSYLAIDQGPIVVMIENYRTGLLWDLFMSNTDIQAGLTKLGFTY
jgi:hypothetical protein